MSIEPKQTAFVCRRECLVNLEGQILTLLDATATDNDKNEKIKSLFRTMYYSWIKKWDNYGVVGEQPTPDEKLGIGN